jgi:hypothetical protein
MSQYRYIFEPYNGMSSRYRCPSCNYRDKTFVRYIDTETGEHLSSDVGRCNRESKCGYHYTPKQYFEQNNIPFDKTKYHPSAIQKIVKKKPTSFIDDTLIKESLSSDQTNYFLQFLSNHFSKEIAQRLKEKYNIGTSSHWNGATIFWEIDQQGKARTGKIMLYDPKTGKRIKEPFKHINWVHSLLKDPEYALQQCLFGEHLLKDKTKQIALVESEKTAIVASLYLPDLIWLAVGSLSNLNAEKCTILKKRNVILFPDLNGFDKWTAKAKELSRIATFSVSDLLERNATEQEREQGLDIADYLLRFDYREFV